MTKKQIEQINKARTKDPKFVTDVIRRTRFMAVPALKPGRKIKINGRREIIKTINPIDGVIRIETVDGNIRIIERHITVDGHFEEAK